MKAERIVNDTITTTVDPMSSSFDGQDTLDISIFISLKKFVNLFAIFSEYAPYAGYGDKHPIPGSVARITQAIYRSTPVSLAGSITDPQVLYLAV
jgi:hypothetical protein